MKRIFKITLMCLVGVVSSLTSCNNTNSVPEAECKYHFDLDGDGLCENCKKPVTPSIKKFEGIIFNNQAFDYDGKSHSIFATNIPSFASVNYVGNNNTEVGVYTVTATITATDYETLSLSAIMTIKDNLKHFDGLVFNSLTVDYDRKAHNIYVENLPTDAQNLNVSYSGNNKTGVGSYTVTATITADGYREKEMSAKLTIKALTFKGVTFKDKTFTYDGNYHSIEVEGELPEGTTVTYSGNNKSTVGTYKVTATIKCAGYTTLTLTATMVIAKMMPVIPSLTDRTLIYDGSYQRINFDYPDNLPNSSTATFMVDGKSVEEKEDLKVKTIGTHTIAVTLSCEKYDYTPTTTTATINVINQTIGGVDSTKKALKIDSSLKYKDLRHALLEGNFTIKEEYFDDYDYNFDGTYEESVLSYTKMIFASNDEVFEFYSMADKTKCGLAMYETSYSHSKIVNEEVLHAEFQEGLLCDFYCYKMPASAWNENIIGKYGISAMKLVKESISGGFESNIEGGYTSTVGTYNINSLNNQIIFDEKATYTHPEFNHIEHTRYTVYNVGNTKVEMIGAFNAQNIDYSIYEVNSYKINGFEYRIGDEFVTASTIFSALDCAYLDKGDFIMPVYVEGKPVKKFVTAYYDKYKNMDCTGYTFKVYFDSKGNYQGEYASLGSITDYKELSEFIDDGGTVLYYGEW